MESVKSIVKDVVYGKSKIHTNMEFTFSNNKILFFILGKKGQTNPFVQMALKKLCSCITL